MDNKKPFGLLIPKKAPAFRPRTSGIFGSDSDDDSAPKKKLSKIPQSKPISAMVLKAEKIDDPSIYEYDSIYDDMKAQKEAEKAPKEQKSSRYIDTLMKAADKRKKEYERRVEKKVQVERESEGDKFKDKEMFVTSAYKKKMLEREEEEERERRENQLNEMMDVTKQKDLSGFYRHFLKQSVGEEKVPVFGEKLIKKEPDDVAIKKEPKSESDEEQNIEVPVPKSVPIQPNLDVDDKDYSDSDNSSSSEEEGSGNKNSYEKSQRVKQYRKQTKDTSEDDSAEESSTKRNRKETSKRKFDNVKDSEKNSERKKTKDWIDVEKSCKEINSAAETLEKSPKNSKPHHSDSSDTEETRDRSNKAKEQVCLQKSHKRTRETSPEDETPEKSPKKSKPCQSDSLNSEKTAEGTNLSPSFDERDQDSDSSDASETLETNQRNVSVSKNGVKEQSDTNAVDNTKHSRNIFEKRTVGEVFAAAQMRYFQRMAARST